MRLSSTAWALIALNELRGLIVVAVTLAAMAHGAHAANVKPLVVCPTTGIQCQLQGADAIWNGTNLFGLVSGSPTTHQTAIFSGPTTVTGTGPGTTGQCFTSNGAASDPSFQACGGGGGSNGTAPTFRGATLGQATGTSLTLALPAGTVAGDFAVSVISAGNIATYPAGWTAVPLLVDGQWVTQIFTKTLTSGDITTGSVTITIASACCDDAFVATFASGAVIAALNNTSATVNGTTLSGNSPLLVPSGPGAYSPNTFYLEWCSSRQNIAQVVLPGTLVGSQMTAAASSASLYKNTFPAVIFGQTMPAARFANSPGGNGNGDLMIGMLNP